MELQSFIWIDNRRCWNGLWRIEPLRATVVSIGSCQMTMMMRMVKATPMIAAPCRAPLDAERSISRCEQTVLNNSSTFSILRDDRTSEKFSKILFLPFHSCENKSFYRCVPQIDIAISYKCMWRKLQREFYHWTRNWNGMYFNSYIYKEKLKFPQRINSMYCAFPPVIT